MSIQSIWKLQARKPSDKVVWVWYQIRRRQAPERCTVLTFGVLEGLHELLRRHSHFRQAVQHRIMSFLFHLAQAGVIVFNDLCMQLCKCSNLALQLSTGNDPQVVEAWYQEQKKDREEKETLL